MKKISCIILLISSLFFMAGCNSNEKFNSFTTIQQETVDERAFLTAEANDSGVVDTATYTVNNPITFNGYDSVNSTITTFGYSYNESADIYTVYNAYIELYVSGIIAKDSLLNVNYIEYNEGIVSIDFTKSIYNLDLGKSSEIYMLQNLAEAYISNIAEVTSVYITVAGEAYESETLILPENEPLVEKDKK